MNDILSLLESLRQPDELLVTDSHQTLTSAMLVEACRALAKNLRQRDIKVLALHGDNSAAWMAIDLACQAASVCLVPLPTFFSMSQIEHVLKLVGCDALITEQADIFSTIIPDGAGHAVAQNAAMVTGMEAYTLISRNRVVATHQIPESTGKITFTSGSTGRPKGVCLSNQQLIHQSQVLANIVGLEKPRHLCLLPLSTLLENVAGLYAPILAGGEIVIPGLSEIGFEGSSSLNARLFAEIISEHQPDSIILTPQLLHVLLGVTESGWKPPVSLKFVAVGGGKISPDMLSQAQHLGIPVCEGYGLSECASVVCLNTDRAHKDGSCGRVLPHLTVGIEEGEIVVSGNAMLGYVGEPDSWGQERIFTGDLGCIDADGYVTIHGRKKNLLISSFGRNINPEWVESELLTRARLSECIVFGDARPYCVALLSPGNPEQSRASLQQSIDTINAQLPDYARVRKWRRFPNAIKSQGDLMTDNGRPKRALITQRYANLIETMYTTH